MSVIRFIGDVHGKMDEYVQLTKGCQQSIQVGDFGAGFVKIPELTLNHQFIRGNHDSPQICEKHFNWIEDGRWNSITRMFFVGGALSIDRHQRLEGVSWWRDEELDITTLDAFIDAYEMYKPETMVTHECPEQVTPFLNNGWKINDPSRTRRAFETMFEIHQPKLWIFGHWHQSLDVTVNGTRFICLNELEHIDLEV